MTLSIIIPIYNVEAYLNQCLDSILVDNNFTGQIICVNDGSTDGSLTILERYAAKYENIEIITQANAGLSVARNVGLNAATGDYIFYLDSDDWVAPSSLDKIISYIDGEDVLYFNSIKYYDDIATYGNKIDIPHLKNMKGSEYFTYVYDKPRNMPLVCVCPCLFSRNFLLKNHLYNEPGIYHEDNYFTPQVLLAAETVSSINEYVYTYRMRRGSITSNTSSKHINDLLYVARNLYLKYEKENNVADIFYNDVCNIYINLINAAYNNHLSLSKVWNFNDSKCMIKIAFNSRSRKIAKLTMISPYFAYKYMQNYLPSIVRRCINKFIK